MPERKYCLQNKVAIVTGGGRGIGRAISEALAAHGASVVVTARSSNEIEATATTIREKGGDALAIQTNVADLESVTLLVEETLSRFGTVDVLVNKAGIQGPIGPIQDMNLEAWMQTIDVNLNGVFVCTKAVLPIMLQKQVGKIINLAGGGATSPRPYFSAYACSKVAVVRFTETIAEELRPYHIDINAISPGAVNTRMTDEVIAARERAGQEFEATKQRLDSGGTPPERAAELAVFLASSASDGLTGKLISAVWDDWQAFPQHLEPLGNSSLLTLRRIDGRNFVEVEPKTKT